MRTLRVSLAIALAASFAATLLMASPAFPNLVRLRPGQFDVDRAGLLFAILVGIWGVFVAWLVFDRQRSADAVKHAAEMAARDAQERAHRLSTVSTVEAELDRNDARLGVILNTGRNYYEPTELQTEALVDVSQHFRVLMADTAGLMTNVRNDVGEVIDSIKELYQQRNLPQNRLRVITMGVDQQPDPLDPIVSTIREQVARLQTSIGKLRTALEKEKKR